MGAKFSGIIMSVLASIRTLEIRLGTAQLVKKDSIKINKYGTQYFTKSEVQTCKKIEFEDFWEFPIWKLENR
jgi:hypothetical protein